MTYFSSSLSKLEIIWAVAAVVDVAAFLVTRTAVCGCTNWQVRVLNWWQVTRRPTRYTL